LKPLRSTVAIVEARPETVGEDYRRLLALAGLDRLDPARRLLVDAACPGGRSGGPVSPPWQIAAVLAGARGDEPGVVHALDGAGRPAAANRSWSGALAATGAGVADASAWQRCHNGAAGLPALAEALAGAAELPRGLAGRPLLVACGMTVGGGWPVAAGLELLARLVAPPSRRRRRFRATGAEIVAEALALVDTDCELSGTVVDGVRWHVRAGRWRRRTLLGNILLAGRDPVAVDAVACRLAGADPLRVPWLRLCAERGLGRIDPRRIDVVGRGDLLDPGLDLPPRLLVPTGEGPLPGVAGGGSWLDWLRIRGAPPPSSAWDEPMVQGAAVREGGS